MSADDPKFVSARKFTAREIGDIYHVPYWFITPDEPRPTWWRHPLVRFRAWRWARESA
jgi:hypothetical protein